jgi:hypothetical protein
VNLRDALNIFGAIVAHRAMNPGDRLARDPGQRAAYEIAAYDLDEIDADVIAHAVTPLLIHRDRRERACLVMVGSDVEIVDLGIGDRESIEIDDEMVLDELDASDCVYAVVAHSHGGSRDARPSDEDRHAYKVLARECRARGIRYDEVIVTRGGIASSIRHRRRIDLREKGGRR